MFPKPTQIALTENVMAKTKQSRQTGSWFLRKGTGLGDKLETITDNNEK